MHIVVYGSQFVFVALSITSWYTECAGKHKAQSEVFRLHLRVLRHTYVDCRLQAKCVSHAASKRNVYVQKLVPEELEEDSYH